MLIAQPFYLFAHYPMHLSGVVYIHLLSTSFVKKTYKMSENPRKRSSLAMGPPYPRPIGFV